jgi:hypothetical protein
VREELPCGGGRRPVLRHFVRGLLHVVGRPVSGLQAWVSGVVHEQRRVPGGLPVPVIGDVLLRPERVGLLHDGVVVLPADLHVTVLRELAVPGALRGAAGWVDELLRPGPRAVQSLSWALLRYPARLGVWRVRGTGRSRLLCLLPTARVVRVRRARDRPADFGIGRAWILELDEGATRAAGADAVDAIAARWRAVGAVVCVDAVEAVRARIEG